jgi:hypothetical protein
MSDYVPPSNLKLTLVLLALIFLTCLGLSL